MTETPEGQALDPTATLTGREKEILGMFATGLPNKVVAAQLSISEHTVKVHAKNIFRKLGVSNRIQAILMHQKLRSRDSGGIV
jgi:DNA-binding NarL/FixJ family response regulator